MTLLEALVDQVRRTHEAHAWYGPCFREVLEGVSYELASKRPPWPESKSICEIVEHVITWKDVTRRRLTGEAVPKVPDVENWPPITDSSERNWQATLERLESAHAAFVGLIMNLEAESLLRTIAGDENPYPVHATIAGVAQHDAYHAGQIALLKKALAQPD